MKRMRLSFGLGAVGLLAMGGLAMGQSRPYIGFAYPAGGQQGKTFQVRLGGQGLSDLEGAIVTGQGVTARLLEYRQKLGPQEITLLREQLADLKKQAKAAGLASKSKGSAAGAEMMMSSDAGPMMSSGSEMMMGSGGAAVGAPAPGSDAATLHLIARIENRIAEYVQRPACDSIAHIAILEVKIAPNAEPGERELRLVTPRGVSNPLPFHVGQLPEVQRKYMTTSHFQVLGKEELAQRKRPPEEAECRISLPCTMNGQVASGEVNKYRFSARKGQKLVVVTYARQLVQYIADAVPGWFQPVLMLRDAEGNEVAYNDDFRFKPDPVMLLEVPKDGEYVLEIYDSIYRGREDFVYRLTIGELPYLTSVFPLGGKAGALPALTMKGWNLDKAGLVPPGKDAGAGIHRVAANKAGLYSNPLPFAVDTLPECMDKEDNNSAAKAQRVQLPIIVNGRIDRQDDADVFQFSGKAGDMVVAEVMARRLESPLDSRVQIADSAGKILAFSDDVEDLGSGVNTHHADSYIMTKLPADGTYFVHLADTGRSGGAEYAYRLRISAPRPDFALRVVPSSIALRSKSSTSVSVYAIRKDGFTDPISITLKDPPAGFVASPVSLVGTQQVARVTIKADLKDTKAPVNLQLVGKAKAGSTEIARMAVPAEDRMQAFLWRHLVPAEDFKALVYDPNYQPPPKRVSRVATTTAKR